MRPAHDPRPQSLRVLPFTHCSASRSISRTDGAPLALLHYLKHAKSLHERVVLLSVSTEDVPHVPASDRVSIIELRHGFWQLRARYGFMQSPDVPSLIHLAGARGLMTEGATFFLGRESVVACRGRWRGWRERLFSLMHKNASPAVEFFGIPPNQVLEVGAQIEL